MARIAAFPYFLCPALKKMKKIVFFFAFFDSCASTLEMMIFERKIAKKPIFKKKSKNN